ncbi:hypothetical protein [Aureimonas glaciei]|uniref:Uncharacterized protein n=1 Tax=Aureimonas glaciei TaxID=1776957 RepID=A0A916XUM8_9HYPH|nr:hypothetical protein [Aureimonas glaciei]GGD11393.1 hypothetical protein GCM10011335_12980 [Aureimonas glaciei]
MSLVRNEQTKLTAQAVDRASTACVAIGVIAPVAAAYYQAGSSSAGWPALAIGSIAWLAAAVGLHFGARRILNGLTE